ncbi:DDE-type integrase/transposase/recombinase [Leptolyngbya sp. FACHB-321]|nr:DDE-type integrase/transposase/recombinase [Leptolyngbya sp. FACHB-321]
MWQAVDAEGNVLDVLLQWHRDTKTAARFFVNCGRSKVAPPA